MTVRELIEKLNGFNQDMQVVVMYRDSGGFYSGSDEEILFYKDEDGKLEL